MPRHVDSYTPTPEKQDDSKPCLVLIHGGALSNRMYKYTIPYLLSLGYTVFAPDLPGHGQSIESGPFTFSNSTRLLYEVITGLKTRHDRVLIVGISLGGQVVLDLVSQ